ncbi:uncharacterized protein TEOVI_000319400 [Trypanosoma equiperdum]|uniref:Uncharacterized protein n=1 Tax=Trypanosoma equiperdum TaxID=5694 RepID=A0A1G4IGS1_TRYEQ|nr:hypothetical protein, conserved [Trypanosoma equiperdum]
MESPPSNDEKHELAVALRLKEEDDALLCAFGPDYFNGARVGAGCGGVFTAFLAWWSFVDLKEDHKLCDSALPTHMRDRSWSIRRGFHSRPFFTVGCVALGITTLMKATKFCLANYRYQEFAADDIGFELLKSMYVSSPEGHRQFEAFVKKTIGNEKVLELPSPSTNFATGGKIRNNQNLTETLVSSTSSFCDRKPPSFWDGVAVGIMGSVMDCYLPCKPLYSYYGMRCGMRL